MSAQADRIAVKESSDAEHVNELDEHEPDADEGKENKSTSTILVEFACKSFDFGVSTGGETFSVPKERPKVVRLLRGGKTLPRA